VAMDAEQRILFANDRAAQLLEFPPGTAVGRKFWEVVRHRPVQELIERALMGNEPARAELNWNSQEAKCLAVQVARLPGLPSLGAVLFFHDVSDIRRLEQLRQEFVANVSHELKTPLSVIKACIETLLDGAVDDPEHRGPFLEQISEQADRLHALILDLLSLAQIESGTDLLDFQPVPLADAVAECVERLRSRADARGQRLLVEPPPGPEAAALAAWADPEAVGQILDNLIDNAVKYTPQGGTVTVRWRGEAEQAVLEVE